MKKEDLLKIIADDELGLLTLPIVSSPISADSRLIESFEEINRFFEEHKREPDSGNGILEHKLKARLEGFKTDNAKMIALKSLDKHNLLPETEQKIKSIDDIFENDEYGILEDESSIFQLKHIPSITERAETDFVARRKPCNNFEKYAPLFAKIHEDIRVEKRKLNIFTTESDIKPGTYFVLDGVLLLVRTVWNKTIDKNHKEDARLHCIFENGTESNMLLRSLGKAMRNNKSWRVVSEPIDESIQRLKAINEDDTKTGYIYIAKSLSGDPKIQSIKDLYKIWFSSTPVEERVKNADKEPTYLFAPIRLCMSVECYNMNPQKFEKIIHTFFWKSCINLDIFDEQWKRHTPREWFSVPIETIEQAIDLIVEDKVLNHSYDHNSGIIE